MAFQWLKRWFKKDVAQVEIEPENKPEDLIKRAILVNNTLTLVLSNGQILSKADATVEDYHEVQKAVSFEEIRKLMFPPKLDTKEEEKEKVIQKQVQEVETYNRIVHKSKALLDTGDFEEKEDGIYVKGIDMSLPPVMLDAFIEVREHDIAENYQAVMNFWRWLALNPNPESREDAFTFIKNNNVKLTPNGLLVLYRRIVPIAEQASPKDEIEFVTKQYVKIKMKDKKSPSHFSVWKTSEGYVVKKEGKEVEGNLIGNLKELYNGVKNRKENTFTDAHTHTMVIKIGDVYSIPEEKVDRDNRKDCSAGLHVASKSFNYGSFGDTPVMVLVNPMKIRAVPTYDTGKMRVSEMFIAAILEYGPNGEYQDEDVDLVPFDDEYFNISVDKLKEMAEAAKATGKYASPLVKPDVSEVSFASIMADFTEMKEALRERIVQI